ncbi:hypothetical protein B5X24_HaOG217149 [Helicoverpa armigera]|uniref:Prefoldin subunit 1 n=1 Tax=Helicoverpa armigera TaxID=29058 RepID=A0A2W1C3T2_HELAM|nr:hypothetical protein B5X24_HaOG217149 [Helicoverpa armigera]
MLEASERNQIIDSQLELLKQVLYNLKITEQEFSKLPPETRTYEPVGRMFLLTDIDKFMNSLKSQQTQLTARASELEHHKKTAENALKKE